MLLQTAIRLRQYSVMKKINLITTPIYYVNASPHMGHLYSSVIADAIQRWKKICNKNCQIVFSTGTDEHGTKIQQSAKANNKSLLEYTDNISSQYRRLAGAFNVDYTDFIRTSEDRHKNTVQCFWNNLQQKGHIYKSTYKGWYCISDETFLSEIQLKEIDKNGQKVLVSIDSGHPVEWSEEVNYIFKLSSFKDDLVYWLKNNEKAVLPQKFHTILLDLISNENTGDISISRPSSRVHWGIPVPQDDTQTVYVWLDALVNYLTVAGYLEKSNADFKNIWPPDVQVIGKDILKFHGVYWPAFLIAADLEPPRTILCHSHWTVDGEKMSKSKGNVVDPFKRLHEITADGLRYFLLREGVNHSDGNYSDTKIIRILNSELADTLGNLLSRCCGKALNPEQVYPNVSDEVFEKLLNKHDIAKKLTDLLDELPDKCYTHYNDFNFYKTADSIIQTLHAANLFFETCKPWELKKNNNTKDELNAVLYLTLETLRICGILLQPLIPNISNVLLKKLAVTENERYFEDSKKSFRKDLNFIGKALDNETKAVLFSRILSSDNIKQRVVNKK